jgi:imidazolonepropionase-like amidohydrolase
MTKEGERTLIFGGPIWNTEASQFEDGRLLVIQGDRIESVESIGELPTGDASARLLNVSGAHVVPGLIDLHFHLISRTAFDANIDLIADGMIEGVLSAKRTLEAGVTTVRDMGTKHRGIHTLKRAINEGKIQGPRAFVAGPNPTGSGAPPGWRNVFADGPEGFRRAVRQEWRAGSDFIKMVLSHAAQESEFAVVLRYMTDEEIRAAVSEAHALGIRTGCHCEGIDAARAAVNAGMDCLDHAHHLDEELTRQMADQGTGYVPTLWCYRLESQLAWGYLDAEYADVYRVKIEAEHRRSFERALAAGVLIGTGSDSIDWLPPQDVTVREIEALVEYGMTKSQALDAATINAARIIGQEREFGSLSQGKLADVLVVDGDPLEDLRALARPLMVMKAGKVALDVLHERENAIQFWTEFTRTPVEAGRVELRLR